MENEQPKTVYQLHREELENGDAIAERFQRFHEANPRVYRQLKFLAFKAVRAGRTKIGIGMLWEVMRWEFWMSDVDRDQEFKLNNDLRSRYARLLMESEPELDGIFETRALRS